jgi:hypothetical protein
VLDVVLEAEFVERVGHEGEAAAKDVDVDIGAFADVPGADAADQPGPEPGEEPHQSQRIEAHVAKMLEPLRTFVDPGHGLDLVADFLVAG